MRFYKPQKGASLPTLTNPADARNIEEGMEAINGEGQKIVGKLAMNDVYTNQGAFLPIKVMEDADQPNMPAFFMLSQSAGDATAADIVKGKTAFTDAGKITGTLEATGGEPSYTLQIATENDSDNTDSIIYYAPGDSMKTPLDLTTSYQSITCGDFICLNRNGRDNYTTAIDFLDSNGAHLLSVSAGTNPNYVVNINPVGWNIINIGAIKRDYPNVSQIVVKYMV